MAEHFNVQGLSDYLVSYSRLITSGHIKSHADNFAPFLQGLSPSAFVAAEVEPMGKDADYVQCIALSSEVGLGVRVEYLGGY